MSRFRLAAAGVICVLGLLPACTEAGEMAASPYLGAWRLLRGLDCARCHGRDYEGWAAPSILDFVRSQPRARFDQVMLDGEPGRGMPGYRGQEQVADRLDEIYEYFVARASGRIGGGRPLP